MCQHTVAGKIPEIKPGIGDLSHGWFLEKKRNGPVCSGPKVKISGNKGCKGCLFVCLFLGIWR